MTHMHVKTSSSGGVREVAPLCSHIFLPGDPVLVLKPSAVVALGGGLRPLPQVLKTSSDAEGKNNTVVVAELCGPVACETGENHVKRYKIEAPAIRRYTYSPKDPVVAIVTKRTANYYLCYTGAGSLAILDALGFDGATKSSRPRMQEGDIVYAFVKPRANSAVIDAGSEEVELSCMAGEVGLVARDWTSTDAVFGPLTGGTIVRVPLPYARSLLSPDGASRLLTLLGERVPFEVCVGLNGFVWVRGESCSIDLTAGARRAVAVTSCILESQEDTTLEEMKARVRNYFPNE